MADSEFIPIPPRVKDLTGQRFGRLVVVAYDPERKGKSGNAYWVCRCDCKNECSVASNDLRKIKGTKSCGCLAREVGNRVRTHGKTATPEFTSWNSMLGRCFNPSDPSYKYHGAMGVTVCEKWKVSFGAFLEDMGPRPSLEYSIDRYPDTNGNYEPGNCRWATPVQQTRNRRNTIRLTFNGETKTLAEFAEQCGIRYGTLHDRIFRHGWTVDRALTEKICHPRHLPADEV